MLDDLLEEDDPEFDASLTDVPVATLHAFIAVVLLTQVGLFAVSLGAMLAAFRGQHALGGALVVGGVVALAVAGAVFARYRPS